MRKLNILCIDDDPVSRSKIQLNLETLGTCRLAEGGAEALTIFKECLARGERFDLVTLDIAMPEMDGIAVLQALRTAEKQEGVASNKRAKIVMVTSHADKCRVLASLKAGCDDFITKPFDLAALLKKIEKYFYGWQYVH
jgi:two-component system chemotaxis response regulator CheY